MLSVLASVNAPVLEHIGSQRRMFSVPIGAVVVAELEVKGSPAIALVAMSQLKPALNWAEAGSFTDESFDEGLGVVSRSFQPTAKGFYMFDWQFYLRHATYRASVRLLVDEREQYRRDLVAGAVPNLNPRGLVGFLVI